MAEADKKKEKEILRKMEQSFALTKAEAYGKFVRRTLREDESPDAYVADLQMLAALSGHMVEDSDEDPMLIEQLIAGLPHVYSKELRLSMAGKKHTVSGCLDMTRALRTASTHAPEVQVAAATRARDLRCEVGQRVGLRSRGPCASNAIRLGTYDRTVHRGNTEEI